MNGKLLLIGCGILKKEIRYLIEKNNWPVETKFLDSALHVDLEQLSSALSRQLEKNSHRQTAVFYGSCHPLMEKIIGPYDTQRTQGQNCAEILLGTELFAREIESGAFFLLEDWARRWETIVTKSIGPDTSVIRDIFTGDRKYLLCLRTPCSDPFEEEAKKAGELVGLPLRWMDINLDNLENVLKKILSKETDPVSDSDDIDLKEKITHLENRLSKLAKEKSFFQLMADLMQQLSSVSGLENTIGKMLQIVIENIGGSNASIYYRIDDQFYYADVFGKRDTFSRLEDQEVLAVFETHRHLESINEFINTKMTTPVFGDSYTWTFPLMVGTEVIGVFRMEDLIISKQEVEHQVGLFFNFAALILKNEILGHTQLQKAYEKLSESEKRYSMTLDAVEDGFWEWDVKTGNAFFSPLYYTMLGYENNEFPPSYNTWRPLVHPDDIERVERELAEGIKKKDGFSIDLRMRMKSGIYLWVSTRGKGIVRDPDGNSTRMIGTLSNITDRKRAEETLQENSLKLKELNATKDKFFSIIAHDLKGPFNSIFGYTNYLISELNNLERKEVIAMMTKVADASQRAYELLDNLLIWANSQTGQLTFNPELTELKKIVTIATGILEAQAENKKIRLVSEIPDHLVFMADRNMLEMVLRNLISNAIKFTPRGGKVQVKALPVNGYIQVSVTDSGVGISGEALKQLFSLENKTSTPGTEKEKGTGLGLIICREFIEKHSGKIWAESEPGKGSTFYFTIPV